MTYEKEMPDYAMLPAKEPEETVVIPVSAGAVYSPMQVTNISEKPKMTIVVEEDVLVPDTKPDMKEILLIDGKARLASREITQINKGDDYINLSGEIELQTLYLPEKAECCDALISIQNRIPFKEQWHTTLEPGSILILECRTEKMEYMVINERKYRVKATLAVTAKECGDHKIDLFEGISDEELQTRKERLEITNIALRKKDTLTIKENLTLKEGVRVENILKQDICVMENYKQAAGEKIIVNGFIFVNLLYTSVHDEASEEDCCLHQSSERVEFTQFIPLQMSGEASGCSVCFDSSDLKVKVVQDEEEGEVLRLEGELTTFVEVYVNTEREVIADAYHREKDFVCDFKEERSRVMLGSSTSETSLREIISPENDYGEIDKVLYTSVEAASCESLAQQGKIVTEGSLLVCMICRAQKTQDDECGRLFSLKQEIPFRATAAMPQIEDGEIVKDCVCLKDFWAEKINGKQIEFNATISVNAEIMREVLFKVPMNPAFEQNIADEGQCRMVVYVVRDGDSLWSIAKHFKTTMDCLMRINDIEENELRTGSKLLILR